MVDVWGGIQSQGEADPGRRGNVRFAITDCVLISHLAEGLHIRRRVLHHFRQIVEVHLLLVIHPVEDDLPAASVSDPLNPALPPTRPLCTSAHVSSPADAHRTSTARIPAPPRSGARTHLDLRVEHGLGLFRLKVLPVVALDDVNPVLHTRLLRRSAWSRRHVRGKRSRPTSSFGKRSTLDAFEANQIACRVV